MSEDTKPDSDNYSDVWDVPVTDTGYRHSPWPFDESNNRLDLDIETAERITICTIKHHLEIIYDHEHDHKVNGAFYHDDDREYDRKLKKAFKRVLKYFGEEDV